MALRELEHGEDLGLGAAVVLVVGELGDDVLVRASVNGNAVGFTFCHEIILRKINIPSVVDKLDGVVGVAEAEATLDFHPELA